MANVQMPPAAYLRNLFAYNPETGMLIWKERPAENFRTTAVFKAWNKKYPGQTAGYIGTRGYVCIKVDDTIYLAHRLIWVIVTGELPPETIDHVDNCESNNAWNNLRAASNSQNNMNRRGWPNSQTGIKGVYITGRGKFRAFITANHVGRNLGTFSSAQEASAAYNAASLDLHGEFGLRN